MRFNVVLQKSVSIYALVCRKHCHLRLVIYEYHFDQTFLFSLIFCINIITYSFLSRDTHDHQYRIWFKETNGYTNNKTRPRVFLEHITDLIIHSLLDIKKLGSNNLFHSSDIDP